MKRPSDPLSHFDTAGGGVAADAHSDAAIAEAVAKQLPGWRIARPKRSNDQDSVRDSLAHAAPGASIDQLRKKFLGAGAGPGKARAVADAAGQKPRVRTFLVEPKDGGPAKVADLVNGEVRIVQG